MERNIYLSTVSIAEAVQRLTQGVLDREALLPVETVATDQALGRVTAGPVTARISSPAGHSAAMDGIAVRASKTFGAREGQPLTLKPTDYAPVNTGHALPPGFDAVIMIEQLVEVSLAEGGGVRIEAPAFPYQHVRKIGEDIVATELIIPRHKRLSAYDLGALLTAGVFEVPVFAQPSLVIIPTGDEVLDYTARPTPGPGQVVESNSVMLSALARGWGCAARRVPPVADDLPALVAAVRAALDSDAQVVVVCAGSSAGSKDLTRTVFETVGEVLVHGVAAMPGKPSLLGRAEGGKLLVGAPGYPVSGVVCFEELLRPILAWLTRAEPERQPELEVELTRRLAAKVGMEEFVRLAVGKVGQRWLATPLTRGAGLVSTLSRAQAVLRIPMEVDGLEAGAVVKAQLMSPMAELERTLVAVGSHDNTLDLLADGLMAGEFPVRLSSTHVGSLGGIAALAEGRAMLAGAHLFDPETHDFNFPFLEKHAPGLEVAVINLAIRHQGLIVAKGNPKLIAGVEDLPRVRFINRQRGAGTRILLDHHLKTAGIEASQVAGYEVEETTHMAVALAVLSGAAHCGLGIFAAAKALDLDFVPLARERYDLIIPRMYLDDPRDFRIRALLLLINDPAFQARIRAQGGYETTLTGQEMRPGQGLNA